MGFRVVLQISRELPVLCDFPFLFLSMLNILKMLEKLIELKWSRYGTQNSQSPAE
jgi:hypothetical protein